MNYRLNPIMSNTNVSSIVIRHHEFVNNGRQKFLLLRVWLQKHRAYLLQDALIVQVVMAV